jgi:hypothetical protein
MVTRGQQEPFTIAICMLNLFYGLVYPSMVDGDRWVCIRIDGIGSIFTASLAAYLVYGGGARTASDAGFSLTVSVAFSGLILWWSERIIRCVVPLRLTP